MGKLNPLFWMRLYVADFLASTHHLSPAQLGAYVRLLCSMWISRDCTLTGDKKGLQRITRVDNKNWPRVWEAIRGLFTHGDHYITDDDLREDWLAANAKRELSKASGSLGGQTTHAKKHWGRGRSAHSPQGVAHKASNPLESNNVARANAQASRVEIDNTKEEREASPLPCNSGASASLEEKEAFREERVVPFPKSPTPTPPESPVSAEERQANAERLDDVVRKLKLKR